MDVSKPPLLLRAQAEAFRKAGVRVEVCVVAPALTDVERAQRRIALEREFGCSAHVLGPDPRLRAPETVAAYAPYRVYSWLKTQAFDFVQFVDELGFYCIEAKRAGSVFAKTVLGVFLQRPQAWVWAMSDSSGSVEDLARAHMQGHGYQFADIVVFDNAGLADWCADRLERVGRLAPVVCAPQLTPAPAGAHGAAFSPRDNVARFFVDRTDHDGLPFALRSARALLLRDPTISVEFVHMGADPSGKAADIIARQLHGDRARVRQRVFDPQTAADEAWPGVSIVTALHAGADGLARTPWAGRATLFPADGPANFYAPEPHRRACVYERRADRLCACVLGVLPSQLPRFSGLAFPPAAFDRLFDRIAAAGTAAGAPQRPDGSSDPLVSLCLVHHERPVLLAQAVDGLVAQMHPNLEFILVDDGSVSPAATEAVAEAEQRLAGYQVQVLRTPDIGLAAARNAAAAQASGDYLLFLDDDNVAAPALAARLAAAAERSGADIVITLASQIEGTEPPSWRPDAPIGFLPTGGGSAAGLLGNSFGDASCLVRRSTFDRLGGFDVLSEAAEDWEFLARAVDAGCSLVIVPEPLYWYRVHDASLTSQQGADWTGARSIARIAEAGAGRYFPFIQAAQRMLRAQVSSPAPLLTHTDLHLRAVSDAWAAGAAAFDGRTVTLSCRLASVDCGGDGRFVLEVSTDRDLTDAEIVLGSTAGQARLRRTFIRGITVQTFEKADFVASDGHRYAHLTFAEVSKLPPKAHGRIALRWEPLGGRTVPIIAWGFGRGAEAPR